MLSQISMKELKVRYDGVMTLLSIFTETVYMNQISLEKYKTKCESCFRIFDSELDLSKPIAFSFSNRFRSKY